MLRIVSAPALLWALFLGSFARPAPAAAELAASQIVAIMDANLRGDSSYSSMEMTITTPKWKRTLKMEIWAQTPDRSLVRINYPPKERGMLFLKLGTQMWNYIPAIERRIKIPPSMMMQSWMGSDFTNDDLVKESSLIDDYLHEHDGREQLAGKDCYRIIFTPKPDAAVVWGRLIFWVEKELLLPVKVEYFSEKKQLISTLYYSQVKNMGGRMIPCLMEMVPANKKGRKTTIKTIKQQFNLQHDQGLFTLNNMRRYAR